MPLLAIKMFFGGLLKRLLSAAAWLLEHPWQAAVLALCALSGVLLWQRNDAREDTHAALQLAQAEIDAHRATKDGYRVAQSLAGIADLVRVARVADQQKRINADVSQNYVRRLADLRQRYGRLRAQARAGAGSAAGGVAVPGPGIAAGGTADAPGADGFSGALALAERLECSAYATQLDELITAVTALAGEE